MKVIDFKDAKCRHCYKCVRHCQVKAITVQQEQARILTDHCINCGRCMEICPQNAKTFASDMDRVKGFLRQGFKTVISIAPSYIGVLDFERPGQVVDALLSTMQGPDVLGRVMQAAAAHARRAADTAPSFEIICRESEAAYAARNPHKKKEDA